MSSYTETRVERVQFPRNIKYGLPLAIDDTSLAYHIGINNKTLWWLILTKPKQYDVFEIPKRGRGRGVRAIQNPKDKLKNVQRLVMTRFFEPIPMGKHVGAYVVGRSCVDTAKQHTGQGTIVSLDIQNFFPSVRRSYVRHYMRYLGYSHRVASLIADLVTYTKGETAFLPQGAPTSGIVANVVADFLFDHVILDKLEQLDKRLVYTRYSDDIDVSHPEELNNKAVSDIIDVVEQALNAVGFRINHRKTKAEPWWDRQTVLGAVVNEKVNIPRWKYRRMRAMIHNCLAHGFSTQYERAGMASPHVLAKHIQGNLSYFKQLDPVKTLRLQEEFNTAMTIHEKEMSLEASF
jgi:RNA-directed DNA polymerase